jgi:hypothetical protein
MGWHTSSASSSSPGIVADIFRLMLPHERAAFHEMLQHELRGRELPDDEMRRAERTCTTRAPWRRMILSRANDRPQPR